MWAEIPLPTFSCEGRIILDLFTAKNGLKDEKSWSEPDLSALWCGKVWFKVVGGQL